MNAQELIDTAMALVTEAIIACLDRD